MRRALFVKTLTKLGSPTRGLTPTLSVSGSLLHIVGVSTHDIYNGLNTNAPRLSCARCRYDSPVPSLRVKPTPPLGERCDKTGRGRGKGSGKYGGAKAELPLTDRRFDNHGLSSLSDQTCQQEMLQQDSGAERDTPPPSPPPPHTPPYTVRTHTLYTPSRVIDARAHHTETRKHIKHVKKCYVQKLGIKL